MSGALDHAALGFDESDAREEVDVAELEALAATNGHVDDEIEFAPDLPNIAHHAVPVEEFAAGAVELADPLIGGADTRLLPAASTLVFYGEGGSGKTTLTIDLAFHLAAGVDWLGFEIARPVRVMLLENEGPIDEYRLKIRRKLASWPGPSLGGRLLVHEAPWGRVDLRRDAAVEGLAGELAHHQIDVLIAGPVRRLGLEGGGTPAETVAYMQLLDRVRAAAGRPLAIANVHHENKGGDISGAFEAEFDGVIHVKADGRDRTQLVFRKSRWSSKIHRSRMTLGWVRASEGFGVLESDLDGPSPAEARTGEELGALEWIIQYVTDEHARTGAGVARGKVETAYHEAHGNRGRNLARTVITTQIALAAEYQANGGTGERSHTLATGPGEVRNGVYLYPACLVPSPLAAPPNGEGGEDSSALDPATPLATSPPPIEEAAAGEQVGEGGSGEGGDDDAGDAHTRARDDVDNADVRALLRDRLGAST